MILGGENYVIATGQTKLNANPDHPGYIFEDVTRDTKKTVRALTPTAYRILHLFVHTLIGVSGTVQTAEEFLNAYGDVIQDPYLYCQQHIINDWEVLKA